jgi:hypothetical protein
MDTLCFLFCGHQSYMGIQNENINERLVGYYYYINTDIHCVMMYNTKHDMMYVSTVASSIHNAKGKYLDQKVWFQLKFSCTSSLKCLGFRV